MSDAPLLDLLEQSGPFAAAGMAPWQCQRQADFAAEKEELIRSYLSEKTIRRNKIAWPYWQARAALLRRWRKRQAKGDTTPRADEFGEWLVEIDGGVKVTIVWDPEVGGHRLPQAEFHGDISKTGYRHAFTGLPPEGVDLLAWLTDMARKFRAETIREWQKRKPQSKPTKGKRRNCA